MDKKATGIVAYITLIGWLIGYFAGDKEGAKFHLNQALVLLIAQIVVSLMGYIPLIGGIARGICSLILFIFWIIGFVGACKGEETPIPALGGIEILK